MNLKDYYLQNKAPFWRIFKLLGAILSAIFACFAIVIIIQQGTHIQNLVEAILIAIAIILSANVIIALISLIVFFSAYKEYKDYIKLYNSKPQRFLDFFRLNLFFQNNNPQWEFSQLRIGGEYKDSFFDVVIVRYQDRDYNRKMIITLYHEFPFLRNSNNPPREFVKMKNKLGLGKDDIDVVSFGVQQTISKKIWRNIGKREMQLLLERLREVASLIDNTYK